MTTRSEGDSSDDYDREYWQRHWRKGGGGGAGSMAGNPPNPYLAFELGELEPGRALDAGCGAGAESIWLAERGWDVTAVDISAEALAAAHSRATGRVDNNRLSWVEADLSIWAPDASFDLVMTHYAHAAMPQLDFYERIGSWVGMGGTLLIVGHLHRSDPEDAGGHHTHPPEEVAVDASAITARLGADWTIVTAYEGERTLGDEGRSVVLHDVVVRAARLR